MDSLFSLAGKRAVITGCATGIGKGMAAGLARAGADIIALDIGDLEDTRRAVEIWGGSAGVTKWICQFLRMWMRCGYVF